MQNPFSYHAPALPQQFVGRKKLLEQMIYKLSHDTFSHLIIGGRKFGKTSLLLKIQDIFIEYLRTTQPTSMYVLPVLLPLQRLDYHSARGFLGFMLHGLFQTLIAPDGEDTDLLHFKDATSHMQVQEFVNSGEQECTYARFEQCLKDTRLHFEQKYGPLRLIFLLDGMETISHEPWITTTFSHLYSLIQDRELGRHIHLVVTGSARIMAAQENGSLFLKTLEPWGMEALDEEETLALIQQAGVIQPQISRAVLQYSGGHPFLTQYIMHYVWHSLHTGQQPDVKAIVEEFYRTHDTDLERWQQDIGENGLLAYKALQQTGTWMSRKEINQFLGRPEIKAQLGRGLKSLVIHGLITQHNWDTYRVSGELFQRWFVEYVLPALPTTTPPQRGEKFVIRVEIHNKIFPTAYRGSLQVEQFPFISCTIKNEQNEQERITVEATIRGYSEAFSQTREIHPGQEQTVRVLPIISKAAMKTLNEDSHAQCRILVTRHPSTGPQVLHDDDYEIDLHAFTTALIATVDAQDHCIYDHADYLAVFVTPHSEVVSDLVGGATKKYLQRVAPGYAGAYLDEKTGKVDLNHARTIVKQQVKAFYEYLQKDVGMVYTNAAFNLGKQPEYFSQRVRPPFMSIQDHKIGQANCLDGTLLFASMLENIGIQPVIVILKVNAEAGNHAIVGWHIWSNIEEYDYLETTLISDKKASFEYALNQGHEQYLLACKNKGQQRPLLDVNGYVRVIDVAKCRSQGIKSLM